MEICCRESCNRGEPFCRSRGESGSRHLRANRNIARKAVTALASISEQFWKPGVLSWEPRESMRADSVQGEQGSGEVAETAKGPSSSASSGARARSAPKS